MIRKVFEELEEMIKNMGVEAEIDSSDGTDTLRIIPDNIGPDEDGTVVMEVCSIPIEETTDHYIQIYTTVAKDIEKQLYPHILEKLNEINLTTVLGGYNLLSDYGMMYHKYVLRLQDGSDEFLKDNIYGAVSDVFAIIDSDYLKLLASLKL